MTWSKENAHQQRVRALQFLLNVGDGYYCRSLEWCAEIDSGIPAAVWSLLLQEGLVIGFAPGGPRWRLTCAGWIEACRLLQGEINLDARFALLSAHLKRLGGRDGDVTSTNAIASATGLPEQWVSDAIEGSMAEIIYRQHGALIIDGMGGVEIPAHLETNSNSTYEEQSVMTPVVCEVRV